LPAPAIGTAKPPFTHLLCAVDFSDSSIAALRFAFSLAQESNARLTPLHVFEWESDEASARRVLETSEFHRQWEAETRQQLEAVIPDDVRNWCTPEPKLAFGKALEQILDIVTAEHVDLILMGVRGRNPVDLMFGSTTNQVVRRARARIGFASAPRRDVQRRDCPKPSRSFRDARFGPEVGFRCPWAGHLPVCKACIGAVCLHGQELFVHQRIKHHPA
jgi:universal stress protein A